MCCVAGRSTKTPTTAGPLTATSGLPRSPTTTAVSGWRGLNNFEPSSPFFPLFFSFRPSFRPSVRHGAAVEFFPNLRFGFIEISSSPHPSAWLRSPVERVRIPGFPQGVAFLRRLAYPPLGCPVDCVPCAAWRGVQQQRQQLPVRLPQPQASREHQQQLRCPAGECSGNCAARSNSCLPRVDRSRTPVRRPSRAQTGILCPGFFPGQIIPRPRQAW